VIEISLFQLGQSSFQPLAESGSSWSIGFLVAFDFLLAAFQPALNVGVIVKNIVDTTL
jgi:hypothetical protein